MRSSRALTAARLLLPAAAILAAGLLPSVAAAQHGDAPKPVATTGLDPLGDEWRETDPYRGNARAAEIGKAGYDQNCARCHGLEVISGGFAPDLRHLALGEDGDALFVMRVRQGVVRNGITYMPKMAEVLSQELLWAIRTYLESKHVE